MTISEAAKDAIREALRKKQKELRTYLDKERRLQRDITKTRNEIADLDKELEAS